jgi:hypothetical protein
MGGVAMVLKPFAVICRPIGCVRALRHRPDTPPHPPPLSFRCLAARHPQSKANLFEINVWCAEPHSKNDPSQRPEG